MRTETLFYQDMYQQSASATVLDCRPHKGGWNVLLDRTVFYPEGGGQYGDRGFIDGVSVLDCFYLDDEICHLCAAPVAIGRTVAIRLDWDLRYRRMQEHSGEHLVSGIIHRDFGYDNVGFHMGHEGVTIDYNGTINAEQLLAIENEANAIIYQNRPIEILYPEPQKRNLFSYRSKKEINGPLRLVRVPDCDLCACCGTHVARTGEIGLIHFTDIITYKGGVRLTLQLGRNALEDYQRKDSALRSISRQLSVPPSDCVSRTAQTLERLSVTEQQLLYWQQRYIEERLHTATTGAPEGVDGLRLCELEGVDSSLLARTLTAHQSAQNLIVVNHQTKKTLCTIRSQHLPLAAIAKQLGQEGLFRGGGRNEQIQGELLCSVADLCRRLAEIRAN